MRALAIRVEQIDDNDHVLHLAIGHLSSLHEQCRRIRLGVKGSRDKPSYPSTNATCLIACVCRQVVLSLSNRMCAQGCGDWMTPEACQLSRMLTGCPSQASDHLTILDKHIIAAHESSAGRSRACNRYSDAQRPSSIVYPSLCSALCRFHSEIVQVSAAGQKSCPTLGICPQGTLPFPQRPWDPS